MELVGLIEPIGRISFSLYLEFFEFYVVGVNAEGVRAGIDLCAGGRAEHLKFRGVGGNDTMRSTSTVCFESVIVIRAETALPVVFL